MPNNTFKIKDFYCKYIDENDPEFSISDTYKEELIQIDVYIKKEDKLKKVNTVVTYKRSDEIEIKKFIQEVMCHEIGKIFEDGSIKKEYFRQGWIYKSYENFYKREGKCYVAEHEEKNIEEAGISYDGIAEEVCDYLLLCGVDITKVPEETIEAMVEDIFEQVDWQFTSSLIYGDEYLEGYVEDFPKEYFFNNRKDERMEAEL